jgi:acyl carrier protein
MESRDEFARAILQIIRETLAAKDQSVSNLGLESPVDERLGLDSLDWAAVVVRMEMEAGIDPFARGMSRELKSISDLVDLYVSATEVGAEE